MYSKSTVVNEELKGIAGGNKKIKSLRARLLLMYIQILILLIHKESTAVNSMKFNQENRFGFNRFSFSKQSHIKFPFSPSFDLTQFIKSCGYIPV